MARSLVGLKDDLYDTSVSKENVNKSDLFSVKPLLHKLLQLEIAEILGSNLAMILLSDVLLNRFKIETQGHSGTCRVGGGKFKDFPKEFKTFILTNS